MRIATALLIALSASLTVTQAQDGKMKKKAAVAEAKVDVAADKAALQANRDARKMDKMSGSKDALKADRKARIKEEGKLIKDEAKKDARVVKEKL
ncbi:MAG: hypothetical protein EOO39_30680 [Cytophagaceae bacterium]|nr:MAG: hypothetical protein EOO39_30680 [Cytophagaceae bacterium]